MPLLRDVMDRSALLGANRLEQLAATRLKSEVAEIRFEKLGLSLATVDDNIITALLDAQDWMSKLLFCIDQPLLHLIIELLCGSDGSEAAPSLQRAFTSLDFSFAQVFCEQIALAMTDAFAEFAPSPITFERIERKLDGTLLGKATHTSVVILIGFEAMGHRGTLRMIMPQMALDRLRSKLAQSPAEDHALIDPQWAQRFETEIGRASASLTAVIEGDVMTLADVAGLQIGQVIGLKGAPGSRVKLLSNDQTYFRGELGQDDGSYTVRINEVASLEPVPGTRTNLAPSRSGF